MQKNDISGFENENQFVFYFDNKLISELDPISQDLINVLYGKIEFNQRIMCRLNLNKQKSDIIIAIGSQKKYISIKKGYKNSVHTENIWSFVRYLRSCNMSERLIQKFLRFHFADGTTDGTGKVRFSSKEYFLNYSGDIEELNEFFNKNEFVKKSIYRLVLTGNNSRVPIDAIIWGTPTDYLWITRDEVMNICLKHIGIAKNGLVISGLFYQPFNRNLNYNPKYEFARNYVQFKWYHLSDDIIETMQFYRENGRTYQANTG